MDCSQETGSTPVEVKAPEKGDQCRRSDTPREVPPLGALASVPWTCRRTARTVSAFLAALGCTAGHPKRGGSCDQQEGDFKSQRSTDGGDHRPRSPRRPREARGDHSDLGPLGRQPSPTGTCPASSWAGLPLPVYYTRCSLVCVNPPDWCKEARSNCRNRWSQLSAVKHEPPCLIPRLIPRGRGQLPLTNVPLPCRVMITARSRSRCIAWRTVV